MSLLCSSVRWVGIPKRIMTWAMDAAQRDPTLLVPSVLVSVGSARTNICGNSRVAPTGVVSFSTIPSRRVGRRESRPVRMAILRLLQKAPEIGWPPSSPPLTTASVGPSCGRMGRQNPVVSLSRSSRRRRCGSPALVGSGSYTRSSSDIDGMTAYRPWPPTRIRLCRSATNASKV